MALSKITTASITDDAVTSAKIPNNAIGTTEVTDNAVTTAKITNANVTTAKITDANITTAKLADDSVTQAKIGADAVGTTELANNVAISTSGAITTTGAFTSVGIDDNGDATTITIDANEDITAANGMYVSGDLTSLTVDKGGIDRSGNTTRIISGRSGGNYADMSINIAGVGGVNRQVYIDYQGNTRLDNGNLVIGTSGKGIDFSATTDGYDANGSELLADYERGAYNLSFNGFSGQTVSQGSYVRVGHLCFVTMMLHALGSQNSNQFTCTLPFTSQSYSASNNTGYYSSTTSQVMHHNVDTGSVGLASFVVQGTNTFKIYQINEDGAWGAINNNAFTSEDQAFVSLTYIVA